MVALIFREGLELVRINFDIKINTDAYKRIGLDDKHGDIADGAVRLAKKVKKLLRDTNGIGVQINIHNN